MYTQDETQNGKKSISNFKGDAVNGDGIVGGGKGSFTMPTPGGEDDGVVNPDFGTPADGNVTFNDDGTIQVVNDGTIKVG